MKGHSPFDIQDIIMLFGYQLPWSFYLPTPGF